MHFHQGRIFSITFKYYMAQDIHKVIIDVYNNTVIQQYARFKTA